MTYPRIMIAAPKSGSGKTYITCALLQALQMRGYHVGAFKSGPDYIDPMFHTTVLGIPSKNLDPFFSEKDQVRKLFQFDNSYDISVIEGAMGLYDGLGGITKQASAYELASDLQTPVILVIDAKGMGYSVVAQIKGFLALDEKNLIKGVILNRISEMFCKTITPVIEKETGVIVLGCFPEQEQKWESRYLGLQLPAEIEDIKEQVQSAAQALEKTVRVEQIIELANMAPEMQERQGTEAHLMPEINAHKMTYMSQHKTEKAGKTGNYTANTSVRIGVARDEAFCFYYADNLHMLQEAGAELVYFSPLRDQTLPPDLDGLLLGGGYPELFAGQLTANKNMRNEIREQYLEGKPVLAECGGFMYLQEKLITADGKEYPMAGAITGVCEKKERLIRFGYVTIEPEQGQEGLLRQGEQIRGHEFHYFDSTNNGCDCIAGKPVGKRSWTCIHADRSHFIGFPHLYYPSCPDFVMNFVEQCRNWNRKRKGAK